MRRATEVEVAQALELVGWGERIPDEVFAGARRLLATFTVLTDGVDERFTVPQVAQLGETAGTFKALVGIDRFDQAVAAMRDELAERGVTDGELFAVLTGAALLVKLLEQYDREVPDDLEVPESDAPPAVDFAFGVLGALINERLHA